MFAGDIVGQLLAWSSLLPIFLLVSFVTVIAFRRDLQTVSNDYENNLFVTEPVNSCELCAMHTRLATPFAKVFSLVECFCHNGSPS